MLSWLEHGLSHRPTVRKRHRIGSSANSCLRLRPDYPNHVWSYAFLFDATDNDRRLKWMPVIDEHTRECLTLEVDRSVTSADLLVILDQLIAERRAPAFIRSDNGPEYVAGAVRRHLGSLNVETRFIRPGAPLKNGYVESFDGTLRNELLSREVFGHLLEARMLGAKYRQEYNTECPHNSLDYQTPAEYVESHIADSTLTSPPA
jgi:transposase InsO family protein